MTISKELLDEILKGCERPEGLLGDAGLTVKGTIPSVGLAQPTGIGMPEVKVTIALVS